MTDHPDIVERLRDKSIFGRGLAVPHELTTKQIEDIAFAVLRSHNDDRLWRALTYDSGPYDVTKVTLALQDLASAFFRAGIASAPAALIHAVPSSCGLTECKNIPKCECCKVWDSMGI